MSFPLVQPNRECPKPGDFSSYYSMDSLKQHSTAICGNLGPELPGHDQTGGEYKADGDLIEKAGCGCQSGGGGGGGGGEGKNGSEQLCKVYASNSSLIVPGPALDLHAQPIGGRPVVSVQSDTTKPGKSMLDRQFDCLQPKWCENCD